MNVAGILKVKGNTIVSVAKATPVQEIATLIAARRIGAVVVVADDNSLAGIVSERDIVRAVAQKGADALQLTAQDIMTKSVTTATRETTVEQAMQTMDKGYFRHLPVVEDGALLGIVSVRDVVRATFQVQANEVDDLKSYVLRGAHAGGLR